MGLGIDPRGRRRSFISDDGAKSEGCGNDGGRVPVPIGGDVDRNGIHCARIHTHTHPTRGCNADQ